MSIFERPSARRRRREQAILAALKQRPTGMFLPDLARAARLHPAKVRICLVPLLGSGQVDAWQVNNWNYAVPPRWKYSVADPDRTVAAR